MYTTGQNVCLGRMWSMRWRPLYPEQQGVGMLPSFKLKYFDYVRPKSYESFCTCVATYLDDDVIRISIFNSSSSSTHVVEQL